MEEMTSFKMGDIIALDQDFRDSLPEGRQEEPKPNATEESGIAPRRPAVDYAIVSPVAYLIGVNGREFEKGAFDISVYNRLEQMPDARIVRNLCQLRTAIEKNFSVIWGWLRDNIGITLGNIPDPTLVPGECLQVLKEEGVSISWPGLDLQHILLKLDNELQEHIGGCQSIFPEYLNWGYLKGLFFISEARSDRDKIEKNNQFAHDVYYGNRLRFPFGCYINWRPADGEGNLLRDDGKFLRLLYERNNDCFNDWGKLSRRDNVLEEFLRSAVQPPVIFVDCENVSRNHEKVIGLLCRIERCGLTDRVQRVVLFDDKNTWPDWDRLQHYTALPVEYREVPRIKSDKSRVDLSLMLSVSRWALTRDLDSAIIVSSDSDYASLIEHFPETRFCVMLEHDGCGQDYFDFLEERHIPFSYIDDLYNEGLGRVQEIEREAELDRGVSRVQTRLQNFLNEAAEREIREIGAGVSTEAKNRFYEKLGQFKITLAENGGTPSLRIE